MNIKNIYLQILFTIGLLLSYTGCGGGGGGSGSPSSPGNTTNNTNGVIATDGYIVVNPSDFNSSVQATNGTETLYPYKQEEWVFLFKKSLTSDYNITIVNGFIDLDLSQDISQGDKPMHVPMYGPGDAKYISPLTTLALIQGDTALLTKVKTFNPVTSITDALSGDKNETKSLIVLNRILGDLIQESNSTTILQKLYINASKLGDDDNATAALTVDQSFRTLTEELINNTRKQIKQTMNVLKILVEQKGVKNTEAQKIAVRVLDGNSAMQHAIDESLENTQIKTEINKDSNLTDKINGVTRVTTDKNSTLQTLPHAPTRPTLRLSNTQPSVGNETTIHFGDSTDQDQDLLATPYTIKINGVVKAKSVAAGSLTHTFNKVGSYTITVTAKDTRGLLSQEAKTVVEVRSNIAPTKPTLTADKSSVATTLHKSVDFTFTFGGSTDTKGDAVTYTLMIDNVVIPAASDVNAGLYTHTFKVAKSADFKTYTIQVTAKDSNNQTSDPTEIKIDITEQEVAPVIDTISATHITVVAGYSIIPVDVNASDANTNNTLTYSITTTLSNLSIDSKTGTITGTPSGTLGTHTVTITVTDVSGKKDTVDLTITLVENQKPSAPTVELSASTIEPNESATIYWHSAVDPEGSEVTYTYTLYHNDTQIDQMVGEAAGSITRTFTQEGTYIIQVVAVDLHNNISDTTKVTLIVKDDIEMPPPPPSF